MDSRNPWNEMESFFTQIYYDYIKRSIQIKLLLYEAPIITVIRYALLFVLSFTV